mmetsp:Transcript_15395/g.33878  ORF Transcript_15395/g.33878 Transcript_15395/m.33878 type:complete len:408 (+) Transcript_15395:133-1356(+)
MKVRGLQRLPPLLSVVLLAYTSAAIEDEATAVCSQSLLQGGSLVRRRNSGDHVQAEGSDRPVVESGEVQLPSLSIGDQIREKLKGSVTLERVSSKLGLILIFSSTLTLILALIFIYLVFVSEPEAEKQLVNHSGHPQSPRGLLAKSIRGSPPGNRLSPAPSHVSLGRPGTAASWDQRPSSESDEEEALLLCPELMVPPGNECSVFVRWLSFAPGTPLRGNQGMPEATATIDDFGGVPVFHVALTQLPAQPYSNGGTRPQSSRRMMLSSATGQGDFAYFSEGSVSASGHVESLRLFRATNNLYVGELMQDDSKNGFSFTLTMRGKTVYFKGDSITSNVSVVDENGDLLAIAESISKPPGGLCWSTTIGPLVDVSVMVLGLLGIKWLEHEARGRPRASRESRSSTPMMF